MHTRRGLMILTLTMAAVLAACGGDDGGGDGGDGGSASATTESAELGSCTVVSPAEVEEALGVTGATGDEGPSGDCLWDADGETSVLNTRLDPPTEGIDLSVLVDETNVTVPGGDQAYYDTEGQCLEGQVDGQRARICIFADAGGDPQAAAQSLWDAAVARL